jgi:hypothetical protein
MLCCNHFCYALRMFRIVIYKKATDMSRRMGWGGITGMALGAILSAGTAWAVPVVVHDTISGSVVSNGGSFFGPVNFGSFIATRIVGQRFHASSTGTISALDLRSFADTPRTLTFSLFSDVGGTIGSLLETFNVPVGTTFNNIAQAASPGSVALVTGADYWIVGMPATQGYWVYSAGLASPVTVQEYYQRTDTPTIVTVPLGGGTYHNLSTTQPLGMRVTIEVEAVSPPPATVPAPPGLALLLAGVALLGVVRRQSGVSAGR